MYLSWKREKKPASLEPRPVNWYVYIILCSDGSLYTGITTDTERRFRQHAGGRGAKYFRGRQPVRLVFREGGHTRSSAARREADIKSLPREAKLLLAASESMNPAEPTRLGGNREEVAAG